MEISPFFVNLVAALGVAFLGAVIAVLLRQSLFYGAVVAISSTTVLSKVLEERGQTGVEFGRLAFAWATVQDLAAIALVVLLATLGHGSDEIGAEVAWELGR